jgi:hypothetical protein
MLDMSSEWRHSAGCVAVLGIHTHACTAKTLGKSGYVWASHACFSLQYRQPTFFVSQHTYELHRSIQQCVVAARSVWFPTFCQMLHTLAAGCCHPTSISHLGKQAHV